MGLNLIGMESPGERGENPVEPLILLTRGRGGPQENPRLIIAELRLIVPPEDGIQAEGWRGCAKAFQEGFPSAFPVPEQLIGFACVTGVEAGPVPSPPQP